MSCLQALARLYNPGFRFVRAEILAKIRASDGRLMPPAKALAGQSTRPSGTVVSVGFRDRCLICPLAPLFRLLAASRAGLMPHEKLWRALFLSVPNDVLNSFLSPLCTTSSS